MRRVNTRTLRDNLAECLDAVEAGERVLVTRRGLPVAEIVRASAARGCRSAAHRCSAARRGRDGLRRVLDQPATGEPADLVDRVLADRGR